MEKAVRRIVHRSSRRAATVRPPVKEARTVRLLPKKTWTRVLLALLVAGLVFLAWPGDPPVDPVGPESMTAVRYHEYGGPEVLRVEQVGRPVPLERQVVIRMAAAGANPLDWHYVRGTPYVLRLVERAWFRPVDTRLGVDVAGVVVAVGSEVTRFKPGDAVYGVGPGAFAEYVRAGEHRLAHKPANLDFEQAAAVPIAAVTALQGLRDKGGIRAGDRVLINGASGGVGTYAVQIAKAYGAHVTGVSSTRNVELVRSLGADRAIDYTRESFTDDPEGYDLILDNVGTQPLSEFRRVMKPGARYVRVGGGGRDDARWGVGFVFAPLGMAVRNALGDREFRGLLAEVTPADLDALRQLIEAGKVTPVIERRYSLAETSEALRHLETGRTRGKVVILPEAVAAPTPEPQATGS
jgi:NADPH:quinone reductase-like Zn-dependent oxidoreductase